MVDQHAADHGLDLGGRQAPRRRSIERSRYRGVSGKVA